MNVFDPTGTEAIRVALTDALSCASPEGLCGVCREGAEIASEELTKVETTLRQIADPSYVGNYSDAEVVVVYRKWAKRALGEAV